MVKSHTKVVKYKTELIFSHPEIIHHFTVPIFPTGVVTQISKLKSLRLTLLPLSVILHNIFCNSAPELLLRATVYFLFPKQLISSDYTYLSVLK